MGEDCFSRRGVRHKLTTRGGMWRREELGGGFLLRWGA
jgi:hypothetical protein